MILDKPINYGEESLDTSRVEELKKTIEKLRLKDSRRSVTVSINGYWGTGKSSYLLTLQSLYEEAGSKVLFFEAWRYAHEPDIFIALLESLKSQVDEDETGKILKKVIKLLGVTSVVSADVMVRTLLQTTAGIKYGAKDITEIFQMFELQAAKYVSKYRENIKLLQKAVSKLGNEENPFVLLVDDLDRLEPQKAYTLLEKLRFYFEGENIVIIMAINDEVINSYVHNLHSIQAPGAMSEAFIDKIFQYSIELSFDGFSDYHLADIQQRYKDVIKETLRELNLKLSHRKWINIANRIEVELADKDDLPNEAVKNAVIVAILKELFIGFNHLYRSHQEVLLSEGRDKVDSLIGDLKPTEEIVFTKLYNQLTRSRGQDL